MGLTLFIYVEQLTPKGWVLPLGETVNPEYDTTTWDRDRYVSKELLISTDKALRAILGYSSKRFCSTTDFESVPAQAGLPKDYAVKMMDGMYEMFSKEAEVWSVNLKDVLAFPFQQKTIVREGYVPGEAAHLFQASEPFPYDSWPAGAPVSYSAMSRQGILVAWTETYAEAAGAEFMEALATLEDLEGEVRLVCVVD